MAAGAEEGKVAAPDETKLKHGSSSPTSPLDAVLPGEAAHSSGKLDDYDVSKAVGKGGYSVVYKGIRKKDQRVVAIKKIEIFDMAPKKRERCLQEVQLLQTCKHPNIIQMLDAFIDDNQLIIVFEWAPAGDLKRLIKKTSEAGKMLEESLIWNYFFQIADAVRYMHKNRVMHRDIKPANVLVGANGALKLGDLGLGRHFSESTVEVFSKVGTPYYVSPEVVKGIGYDWKSDVWSLGCLLYELAVLKSPFEMEGANLYDVFQKINAGDYTPLPNDRHSKVLQNLVARMLQTDPEQRPEMEEVWQVTRSVFDHQHHVSRSTHLMSEQATDKLVLLGTELERQERARRMLGGASEDNGAGAVVVGPPSYLLRELHPLLWAESDAPKQTRSSGGGGKKGSSRGGGASNGLEGSSYQFAIMLGACTWLLQLNGRSREAEEIEKEFSAASGADLKRSPRSGGALKLDDASRLRIGERLRSLATSLGMEVDFATPQGIASGCGRSVCMLLNGLAEKALKSLNVRAKKPIIPEESAAGDDSGAYEEILEDLELPEEDVITGETYEAAMAAREAEMSAAAAAALRSADGDDDAGSRCMIAAEVDAGAWRAEAERLAPQLSRISLKAEAGGKFGAWETRLLRARQCRDTFEKAGPAACEGASAYAEVLRADIEKLSQREGFVNREWGKQASEYAAARDRLAVAISARERAEESVSVATSHLAELTAQVQSTAESIEERQADFDGARPLERMKSALGALQEEIQGMNQRVEIVRGEYLIKQKKAAEEIRRQGGR